MNCYGCGTAGEEGKPWPLMRRISGANLIDAPVCFNCFHTALEAAFTVPPDEPAFEGEPDPPDYREVSELESDVVDGLDD